MTKLKDLLDDVLELAEKHGLDVVDLLYDIASAASATAEIGNAVVPAVRPMQDTHALAAEHARTIKDLEHLHIAQQFWLRQPVGFHATAADIYALAGLPWRHGSKRLSFWLSGNPAAKARRAGWDHPGRIRVWERI